LFESTWLIETAYRLAAACPLFAAPTGRALMPKDDYRIVLSAVTSEVGSTTTSEIEITLKSAIAHAARTSPP
jgi:hypothetical protein